MPEDEIALSLAGEEVLALADRALFWPRGDTLLVADIHFGKDATLRRALRWVPPGTTTADLARLTRLVKRYGPRQLVILGDAFHSEHADEIHTFEELRRWRSRMPAHIVMVKGNHDRRAGQLAQRLDFEVVEEDHAMLPWSLRHHPAETNAGYVLCGHIHPVVRVRGAARQSLRVPCFWIGPRQCVLPAFGGLTGGGLVRPQRGDRILLLAGGRILEAASSVRPAI